MPTLNSLVRWRPGARRRVSARLATAEFNLRALNEAVDRHERKFDELVRDEISGLFLALQRDMTVKLDDVAAVLSRQIEATAAAVRQAARAHTEASVAAGMGAVRVAAEEHVEAAVAASQSAVIATSREHTEAAVAAVEALVRRSARDEHESAVRGTKELGGQLRREIDVLRRTMPQPASPTTDPGAAESPAPPRVDIDPSWYVALEDRFRGSFEQVADRQRVYLDVVRSVVDDDHPAVDLGSGRGEWLRLLQDEAVPAFGIDTNIASVRETIEQGLDVRQADLVDFIHHVPEGSLGAVTLFHVVEHLPFVVLVDVLGAALRALRPGGVLIAETPNAMNLRVASSNFWIDPTHQRPLHPLVLEFIAEHVGFARTEGWFLNELGESPTLPDDPVGNAVRRLVELVDGPGDFSLVAWT